MRLALAVVLLAACGPGGGSSWSVTDQPLAGVIDGAAWTFAAGDTDAFLSDEEGYFASLYGEDFEACGFSSPEPPFLLLSIPTEPGEYSFSLSGWNSTIVPAPGENLIVLTGGVIVDEITDTTISGGIYARFDGDNELDGNFTVTICADE